MTALNKRRVFQDARELAGSTKRKVHLKHGGHLREDALVETKPTGKNIMINIEFSSLIVLFALLVVRKVRISLKIISVRKA